MSDITEKAIVNALKQFAKAFDYLGSDSNSIEKTKKSLHNLLEKLMENSKSFDPETFVDELNEYIDSDKRLLYSEITLKVNELYEKDDEKLSTLLSNLDKLYEYQFDKVLNEDVEKNEKLKKIIIKLWDHVNLANVQIDKLKMSDKEFQKRIDPTISKIQESNDYFEKAKKDLIAEIDNTKREVSDTKKDIYTQLITIVSVFVAIAFVMFGGMSLLNNLFDYSSLKRVPLLEMLCCGSLIGIIIINAIYAFIVLILKITILAKVDSLNLLYEKFVSKLTKLLTCIVIITGVFWLFNVNGVNDFSNSAKSYKTQCKTVEYNKKTKEVTLICPADITDTKEQN